MSADTFNQIAAIVAAVLTGIVLFVRGGKSKAAGAPNGDYSDREIARLRDERQQDRDHQMSLDIKAMRADFEIVVRAMKESIDDRFDEILKWLGKVDERLREMEKQMAVVEDRQHGPRRR